MPRVLVDPVGAHGGGLVENRNPEATNEQTEEAVRALIEAAQAQPGIAEALEAAGMLSQTTPDDSYPMTGTENPELVPVAVERG